MLTALAQTPPRQLRYDRWACSPSAHFLRDDLADSLVEFWIQGRTACGLPDRDYFDASNLRPWLGYLSIYERIERFSDFRNRLEGTEVIELTGENWQGRLASEVDGHFGCGFLADLRLVAVWRHPKRSLCRVFQKPYQVAERILLPVTVDGREVDQVIMALFPTEHPVA